MGVNMLDEIRHEGTDTHRRTSTVSGERPTFKAPPNRQEIKGNTSSEFDELKQKLQEAKTSQQRYGGRPRRGESKKSDLRGVPPAPSAGAFHAQNYDEAPPGLAGPDFSGGGGGGGGGQRPGYTRGLSAIDNTAVFSAGPTPAVERSNPLASAGAFVKGGSRARESHLPDLDIRDADDKFEANVLEEDPEEEISGHDAFAPSASRRETEAGAGDPDTRWEESGAISAQG